MKTSITVVEHIAAESPANVTDLTSEQLDAIPGINLDDQLKQLPGFSLFRRSTSEVANPTTQGVSLRGIGSSGASRTLVLFDGTPVNDPFGGWVYWTRFAPIEVERVEVSRGASTSLFGNLALGGAINVFPRESLKSHYEAAYEFGTENTHDLSAGFARAFRNFAISGSGRGFTTDGYYIVAEPIRGAIDRRANVRFFDDTVRLDGFSGPHHLYAWFNSLVEERGNGTYITHNSTAVGTAALRYLYQGTHDGISISAFGSQGQYHATFSSITNNRNTESLTSQQTVPEEAMGGAAIWTHSASLFNLTVGSDVNRPRGFSTDRTVFKTVKRAGGALLEHGEFVQADMKVGALKFFAGGRDQFTGQGHEFFEPSGGLSYGKGHWRARASAYHAFRTPSLNELYRDFRAGNTLTTANPLLQPEKLLGVEVGGDYVTENGLFRVTAFHNDLTGLITNVTLRSTPALITRQRQNASNAVGQGIEANAHQRWGSWTGDAAYLYADSRYVTGLRIAQVPKHQGSAMLSYSQGRTLASASVRSYSYQFDDDLNKFLLPGFAAVELLVRERLTTRLAASLEVTNALDKQFLTAYTPTPTIGEPRLVRGGLLWRWN